MEATKKEQKKERKHFNKIQHPKLYTHTLSVSTVPKSFSVKYRNLSRNLKTSKKKWNMNTDDDVGGGKR